MNELREVEKKLEPLCPKRRVDDIERQCMEYSKTKDLLHCRERIKKLEDDMKFYA